jgi:hypothetical protein
MMFLLLGTALAQDAQDTSGGASWTLVGLYDAAAVTAMDPTATADYAWEERTGMTTSCGPTKTPDGLGMFEAAAMANRLTPTLAIVLERSDDSTGPLESDQVRIGLGEAGEVQLQPAVNPRFLNVVITGEGEDEDWERYEQLIRTQVAMEVCLEHKTGRGWVGGGAEDLREAFLLDERDKGQRDRKYYAGEKHPVPALLGPPDACVRPKNDAERRRKPDGGGNGKGESSMGLVPSDVWGSDLRVCNEDIGEVPGYGLRGRSNPIQLRLSSEDPEGPPDRSERLWTELRVHIDPGEEDRDVVMDVYYGPRCEPDERKPDEDVNARPECEQLNVDPWTLFKGGTDDAPVVKMGLEDVLSKVPHTYPTLENGRYAVLLIPNWQVVEAIRRSQDYATNSMTTGGGGLQDGVGWLLEHPEFLHIQLAPAGVNPRIQRQKDQDVNWPNLSTAIGGHKSKIRAWGYTVGQLSGRKPVALPSNVVPTWDQAAMAQRATQHGYFIGACAVLLFLLGMGLRRVSDLWSRVPEERVAYWPGRGGQAKQADAQVPSGPPPGVE